MTRLYKTYGFWGIVYLSISYLYTKFFFPEARLIRLPFDIRNKRNILIGDKFTSGRACRFEVYNPSSHNEIILQIGKNVQVNDYVHIGAANSVIIGDNVLIASKVYISDHNHGSYSMDDSNSPLIPPNLRKIVSDRVVINDNVWLGESVCVLPGVSIGEGSIIGALSVVTKDIPDYSIAVGIPAKVIKYFDFGLNKWVSIQ
jgi:lipopolysaccharide O-acetyltransferase